jgi:hypothetical protein
VKALKITGLVLFLLFAVALTGGGIAEVVAGFGMPDPAVPCRGTQTGHCFTRERAVVTSVPGDLEVSYDDGLRSTTLSMRGGARPETGARLWLERWNGDIVALYDPVSERRYRTIDWPVRWSGMSFALPLVWAIVGLACVLAIVRGIVRTARAKPRAPAPAPQQ